MKMEDPSITGKSKEEHRDRRVAAKPRATIQEIIENMETQADLSYQGNLSDNVLKIFNDLATDDKRTFLRHAIKIVWERRIELAKRGMEDIIVDQTMRIDPVAVAAELDVISKFDHEEQMRLRSFIIKSALVVSTGLFFLLFGWAYMHGTVGQDAGDLLEMANKLSNILLDQMH